MFLSYVLLVAYACLCLVKSEPTTSAEYEDTTVALEAEEDEDIVQQSVALIDIVFTDGKKRTCTGAIIHDYVVITAGHCFIGGIETQSKVPPELTASFVVIGTKNKFEAGYEQYLPIERVVTHPDMKAWKADLALIHTFASMTANKIGAVIPLANDKNYGPGDGNFTILSWGRIMGAEQESEPEESEKEESNSCAEDDANNNDQGSFESNNQFLNQHHGYNERDSTRPIPIQREGNMMMNPDSIIKPIKPNPKRMPIHPSTKKVSRYLSSNEHRSKPQQPPQPIIQPRHRYHKMHRNLTAQDKENSDDETRRNKVIEKKLIEPKLSLKKRAHISKQKRPIKKSAKNNWGRSWRRQMSIKEANRLTVESFGFIGNQPCKKMVTKIVPQMHLNSSEIVCYASDDHYVTDEDSGAPAIRQGELVALTVGGIVSEGDHVAVGIKLSEFCAWMSENLPAGTETSLNCWSHSHSSDKDRDYDESEKDEKKINADKIKAHRNRYLGSKNRTDHPLNGIVGHGNHNVLSSDTHGDSNKRNDNPHFVHKDQNKYQNHPLLVHGGSTKTQDHTIPAFHSGSKKSSRYPSIIYGTPTKSSQLPLAVYGGFLIGTHLKEIEGRHIVQS